MTFCLHNHSKQMIKCTSYSIIPIYIRYIYVMMHITI